MSAQVLNRWLRWLPAIVILASAACREQVVVGYESAIDAGVVRDTESGDAAPGSDMGADENEGANDEMVSEQGDDNDSDEDDENVDTGDN